VRREYLGLLRHILEGRRGDTWRACRNVALVALGLPLFAVAWGWAPTFYFRFLDRLSSVLLDSMHLAANYACRRAGELLGEEERGWERRSASRASCSRWRRSTTRGARYAASCGCGRSTGRRLLEGGCSELERLLIERGIL